MTENYIYKHYKSIWRDVDNGNAHRLAVHPDLQEKINEKNQGSTPLFLACMRKNYPIVCFLLEMGADPNIECKGITPLYLACLYAETEIVDRLLLYGANPNVLCTTRQIAPIHLASSKGTMDILDLLLKNLADVNIQSSRYGSPVHIAVSKNHRHVLEKLISSGAPLNTLNAEGETPLHIASRSGWLQVVRMLLEKSANPTVKDKEGNTALHMACYNNHETIALLLIANSPDLIYIRNHSDRQTPTFYATESVRRAIKNAFTNKKQGFSHAINDKTFSDITYVVEGKPVYAHRVILHYRCPALPQSPKEIIIREIEHQVFLAFLTYLYTDSLQCEKSLIPKLVQCAERFKVIRLKKLCQDVTSRYHVDVPESTFSQEMRQAINNPQFSDVTFIVDSNPFHCHKILLIEHDYFRAMFSQNLKESHQKEIPMQISSDVFSVLIHYTYTWEIKKVPEDILFEVFLATDQFMVSGLRHVCEMALCEWISQENVCQMFQFADTYKSLFLKEECFDFIIDHYHILSETEDYQLLSKELVEEIAEYIDQKKRLQNKPKDPIVPRKDNNFSLL